MTKKFKITPGKPCRSSVLPKNGVLITWQNKKKARVIWTSKTENWLKSLETKNQEEAEFFTFLGFFFLDFLFSRLHLATDRIGIVSPRGGALDAPGNSNRAFRARRSLNSQLKMCKIFKSSQKNREKVRKKNKTFK